MKCPRCGLPDQYQTPVHLDVCGKGERWRAKDYIGKSAEQQDRMRAIERQDVIDEEAARAR